MNWTEAKYNYIREALGDKRPDEGDSYYAVIGNVIEKEKEKMYTNTNEIKLIVNNRTCNVDTWSITDPCSPWEMPRIRIEATMTRFNMPYNEYASKKKEASKLKGIKNVIFNPPATIVFWEDGTKTVVKAENEAFDPEKGLAMAITKKVLGNKGNYFETVKKWTKTAPVPKDEIHGYVVPGLDKMLEEAASKIENAPLYADDFSELDAKLKEFEKQLVVGNRVTKKLYKAFLDILMPDTKDDEA